MGDLGHQRPHTFSLKQPLGQAPSNHPPNCGPRGRGSLLPTRARVVPKAAISMATNNKHPGNHSGTGSGSHVTGRQFFFFSGGVMKLLSSPRPGGISGPLSLPHLELEGRGQLGRCTPTLQWAQLVAGPTGPPSPPATHGSPRWVPLPSTSCRDWRSENSPPQLPLLKSRFLG